VSKTSLAFALAALSLLAICPANLFAQSGPEVKAKIDEIVSRHMKAGEVVGLEIGVVIKGGQAQTSGYGEVLKRSGRMPSASTLFQIGSITKTFTGVLLALFVERSIVQLDDPMQKYVPQQIQVPSYNGRQILLVDLATHTSGLPRDVPMRRGQDRLTVDQMYQGLHNLRIGREPGQQYEYSNWGFGLLADALTRVAKSEDYQAVVQREVLSKLGMGETTLRPGAESEARVAQGYAKDGYAAPWNMPTWPALNGSGALYSSMTDMLKYLSFHLGLAQTSLNSILKVVHQSRTHGGLRSGRSTGLAWEILDDSKSKLTRIEKDGGTLGFRSYIGFIRGEPTGVVVLANSVATGTPQIGRQILTLLAKNQ
jgi:serine-type D-Ala-D-Ala carboxypeptidase/endopeptidase